MIKNGYGGKKQTVLMFPWLGHGHISPFLELAKKLTNTNRFNIHLCSTPTNLDSIKKTCPPSVNLIELHLPTLPDLPPHLHTTNGLPLQLMSTLKQAFDMASPRFSDILINLKPDLLIYDIIQPWAPIAAAGLGIPSVVFITTSASASMVHFQLGTSKNIPFPFSSTFYYHPYEDGHVSKRTVNKEADRVTECVQSSSSIVLVKSCKEIEAKYAHHLSRLIDKRVVPVGPLVAEPPKLETKQNNVIDWLDTKSVGSTVFVSFGSEYFLSNADLAEIAYGLEMSNVNFIWVLRFPKGENRTIDEALPQGFIERVKSRGLVMDGWAPQARILGHKNIGGFVSHCGWNSVLEAMKFGVPVIAMPMHLDQPINARLAVAVGVGVEVVRDDNGKLKRETISSVLKRVVMSELGNVVRENAKKLGDDLRVKKDEEIDVVTKELIKLCKSAKKLEKIKIEKIKSEVILTNKLQKTKSESFGGDDGVRDGVRGGGTNKLQKTKSEAFAICALHAMKGGV
ncbi:UDP-glucosyltransferase 29-like [Rutidosis leptorrhynchoides]|uniref:UDP-glucosyltransferase 29-like n=1 Tax=Rutidosis leptorrhynchoides TaxID=125765 RepID=UPI003A98F5CD